MCAREQQTTRTRVNWKNKKKLALQSIRRVRDCKCEQIHRQIIITSYATILSKITASAYKMYVEKKRNSNINNTRTCGEWLNWWSVRILQSLYFSGVPIRACTFFTELQSPLYFFIFIFILITFCLKINILYTKWLTLRRLLLSKIKWSAHVRFVSSRPRIVRNNNELLLFVDNEMTTYGFSSESAAVVH